MRKFKAGDWIEFKESLRPQSYDGSIDEIDPELTKGQSYDPNTQHGGFSDDSAGPYYFIVYTYNCPYRIDKIKDNKFGYSICLYNEYGVYHEISITPSKLSYIELSKKKIREDKINDLLK